MHWCMPNILLFIEAGFLKFEVSAYVNSFKVWLKFIILDLIPSMRQPLHHKMEKGAGEATLLQLLPSCADHNEARLKLEEYWYMSIYVKSPVISSFKEAKPKQLLCLELLIAQENRAHFQHEHCNCACLEINCKLAAQSQNTETIQQLAGRMEAN